MRWTRRCAALVRDRGPRRLRRRGRLRRADQGLGGAAQRAHRQPLPLRHPRGPAPPRARAGQRVRRPAVVVAGTAAPALQALLPGHRLDPAPRGRAPAAVRAAALLPAPRRAAARAAATARSRRLGLPVAADGRAAAAGGPLLRRRLVRARRRAEAVARPRGHRPRRQRPAVRGRAAGRPPPADGPGRRGGRPPRSASEREVGTRPAAGPAPDHGRERATQPVAARRAAAGSRCARVRWRSAMSTGDRGRTHLLPAAAGGDRVRARWRSAARPRPAARTTRSAGSTSPTRRSPGCSPRAGAAVRPARGRRTSGRGRTPRRRRLRRVAAPLRAGLTDLDVEMLLVALAPDLDEPVRAALRLPQRRRDPAARLGRAGAAPGGRAGGVAGGAGAARRRRAAGRTACWSSRTPTGRSCPRALRVPDRVVGPPARRRRPDAALPGCCSEPAPSRRPPRRPGRAGRAWPAASGLPARARRQRAAPRWPPPRCRRRTGGARVDCAGAGRARPTPADLAGRVLREALLRGAGVVAGPLEALARAPVLLRAGRRAEVPVWRYGSSTWDPQWSSRTVPLQARGRCPWPRPARAPLWRARPGRRRWTRRAPIRVVATAHFVLGPRGHRPGGAGGGRAARSPTAAPVARRTCARGARARTPPACERLARRIEPAGRLGRPRAARAGRRRQLHELAAARAAPRPGARRLADAPRRRPRPRRHGAVRRATPAPARRCRPR